MQTYVTNLNVAEEKYAEAVATEDVSAQIALQGALKFNGGGHINHTIFWTNLCPSSETDIVPNSDQHGEHGLRSPPCSCLLPWTSPHG